MKQAEYEAVSASGGSNSDLGRGGKGDSGRWDQGSGWTVQELWAETELTGLGRSGMWEMRGGREPGTTAGPGSSWGD